MRYPTKSTEPPNRCIECGEHASRHKHFCSDRCEHIWRNTNNFSIDLREAERVTRKRRMLGITPQALNWRRKLSVSRAF